MPDYTKELAVAKRLALQAGEIMKEYFRDDIEVGQKKDSSPITIADTTINSLVISELDKEFDDGIVGEEESTAEYGMGRRWICDPIDGTRAYVWGVPTAMFSLGFVVDGSPVVGVTYDPFLNLLYEAVEGKGSYCNGKPIRISESGIIGGHVAVSGSVEKMLTNKNYAKLIENLADKEAKIAAFSGSVYKACMVARGRLVGYVEKDVNPHDLAAVEVIVKEAGGLVTDFEGNKLDYSRKFKGAIVSNKSSYLDILSCVQMDNPWTI